MAMGMMRASVVMAAGTTVSRVLGLAKALLLAYAIGVGVSGDAFGLGNQLPNTVYTILLGGMFTAVLVPQIVQAARGEDAGAGYINKLLTLAGVALFAVTALATIAAPVLVRLYGLDLGPEELALATAFAYWCLPQILFYGLYAVLGEVLNAKRHFGPATWSPVLNNVIAIAGLLAFIWLFGSDPDGARGPSAWTPEGIAVLAGSATLGVVLQALILFVSWRRAGIRYRPDFAWRGMGLRRTAQIAGWSLGSVIVTQLGGIVTTNVAITATGQGPSVAQIALAWLVFMLPHSVIAISIATATFTRMAEGAKSGDLVAFRSDLSLSMRSILIAMVLAATLVIVNAHAVSRVLLAGQSDGSQDIQWLAWLLIAYVVGLPLFSVVALLMRGFYALDDTRTPFFLTLLQTLIVSAASVACLLLPPEFRGIGIAAVYSLATAIQALLALMALRRKIGGLDLRELVAAVLRSTIAAIPAILIGLGVLWISQSFWPGGVLGAILSAVVVAIPMTLVYLGVLRMLKSPELDMLSATILGRLRRR